MNYALNRTVEPSIEPVSLEEAKLHCRIDDGSDDAVLSSFITAARIWAEDFCRRSFITSTWELSLDEFPGCDEEIRLERPKIIAVSSITYIDTGGTTQTLSSSLYRSDVKSTPGRVTPVAGTVWPATQCDTTNTVTITFTAGYGSTAASVPQPIRTAIAIIAATLSENRENVNIGNIVNTIPLVGNLSAVESLLWPYRWTLR